MTTEFFNRYTLVPEEPDKGLTPRKIAIYGASGNISRQALNEICKSPYCNWIETIFLFDLDTKEQQDKLRGFREQAGQMASNRQGILRPNIKVEPCDALRDLAAGLDLIIFAAAGHGAVKNREEMIEPNLAILKEFQGYLSGYRGILNIVSNIPEVLAHEAAGFMDPGRITAHIPLDTLRLQYLIRQYLPDEVRRSAKAIDAFAIGFHDSPVPILNGCGLFKGEGEQDRDNNWMQKRFDITEFLLSRVNIGNIEYRLKNKGQEEFNLLGGQKSPTAPTAGIAIADLVRAFIYDGKTVTGVPYDVDGRWFYVPLPVKFTDGIPDIDTERFARITPEDHEKLREVTRGDTPGCLEYLIDTHVKKDFTSKPFVAKAPVKETRIIEYEVRIGTTEISEIREEIRFLKEDLRRTQGSKASLKGDILYTVIDEPLVVRRLSLETGRVDRHPLVLDNYTGSYHKRVAVRAIIPTEDGFAAEAFYSHPRKGDWSHWIWSGKEGMSSQRFTQESQPTSLHYIPPEMSDTFAAHQRKVYYIAKIEGRIGLLVFDPSKPDRVQEIAPEESLEGVVSTDAGVIAFGNGWFYRIEGDRLKKAKQYEFEPLRVRSTDGIIIYSGDEKRQMFSLHSTGEQVKYDGGKTFDVLKAYPTVVATVFNDMVRTDIFNDPDALLGKRIERSRFIGPINHLSDVKVMGPEQVVGIAHHSDKVELYFISPSEDRIYKKITLEKAVPYSIAMRGGHG